MGGFAASLWLLGLGILGAWVFRTGALGGRQLLVAGLLLLAGAVAAWHWWHTPHGEMVWDGLLWHWRGLALPAGVAPVVVFDFQVFLLLRWPAPGAVEWLCLERSGDLLRWRAVRRAVYSRARIEMPSGPQSDPANP